MPTQRKKPGRPQVHDHAALMQQVCDAIADGALVEDAARAAGTTAKSIRQWALEDAALGALYARARESQAHALAEQALAIANGTDALTLARSDAIEAAAADLEKESPKHWRKIVHSLESNLIQRDRLRVDSLKWMTSKIAPRLFGERSAVDITSKGEKISGVVVLPAVEP